MSPIEIRERALEDAIEQALLERGWRRREPDDYDRRRCLDPGAAIDFVYATQPKAWHRLVEQHGEEAKERFISRLASEVRRRGMLDVLRKGIKCDGASFELAYFLPASGLNPELRKLYEANVFTVVRQLCYSEHSEDALDLGLFLNGLPVFTVELKNPPTGQNVEHAIRQYRYDRDPREPLLELGRSIAHFAVDTDLVYVTTKLEGPATRFLPFNRGRAGGAGNPPSALGFATGYLWEDVWRRESILELVQYFFHVVEEEDDEGRKTGEKSLIFPRYHQLECVRALVSDAMAEGPGKRYLIQHSAGSGKSNSIAWLAHRLSVVHDEDNQRVFDSIIVVTDRRVLDRQLQRTVRQFEQTRGIVENIDTTSRQLKEALEAGKTIVVTTLQKFPVIADEVASLPGKRFAVIVDEAHSSQTGESTKPMNKVLSAGSLEEAEAEDAIEEDLEDVVEREARLRGPLSNVSTFAFTATPKEKTLELFGAKRPDGKPAPFSLYTMRQAIEEKFILDVLENYTTYATYWRLLKTVEEDPHYDKAKASYLLRSFVELSQHAIDQKVAIAVEHFADRSLGRIGGKAKGMIVTRSRLHAVRYKLAVDRYLAEKGYPIKALVAFSGEVRDGGKTYSEPNMNGFSESQTAAMFERDENRLLIVAEKFQTGFDQPLLHTMYVDRKLAGVHAVQALSRLNRVHPEKEETLVLDFVNDAEDIRKGFEPYYDRLLLSEGTDPNLLYDLETRLGAFHLFGQEQLDAFAAIYFDPAGGLGALHAVLDPIVVRFDELEEAERVEFRGSLGEYVRLYAFLSQVIRFVDADLEKLYVFGRVLLRKLPVSRDELPREIQEAIDVESYRIQKTRDGRIDLERGVQELEPRGAKDTFELALEDLEPLSQIIRELNDRFGVGLTEEDRLSIERLLERISDEPALEASVRVNTPENARLTFDHVVNDRLQDMIESNFKLYKQIADDPEFGRRLLDRLFERYVAQKRMDVEGAA